MRNSDTEQKIKLAAKKVFHSKGYTNAKTRDIANEASVNLALINYYYSSKKCLFEEIMSETLDEFKDSIITTLNDKESSIDEKITQITDNYFQMIQKDPNLPEFIFLESKKNPELLLEKIHGKGLLHGSYLEKQLIAIGLKECDTEQIFINIVSLVVFPFIGKAMIKRLCDINDQQYQQLLEKRKNEIPTWIHTMFNL